MFSRDADNMTSLMNRRSKTESAVFKCFPLYLQRIPYFLTLLFIWYDFCFTALQHILGHFGRGQLPSPHCSWASLLGSLPLLNAHSFVSNWQLLFLNQRKNGRRNVFMTNSPRKNVPDVGIELGAAYMPSRHTSDRSSCRARLCQSNTLLNSLNYND